MGHGVGFLIEQFQKPHYGGMLLCHVQRELVAHDAGLPSRSRTVESRPSAILAVLTWYWPALMLSRIFATRTASKSLVVEGNNKTEDGGRSWSGMDGTAGVAALALPGATGLGLTPLFSELTFWLIFMMVSSKAWLYNGVSAGNFRPRSIKSGKLVSAFHDSVGTNNAADQLSSVYFDLNYRADCGVKHCFAFRADHEAGSLGDHFHTLPLLHH